MELRVVATAGHVDHGKSSLIVRLTGIDPDRWAEEKRRGLTIDLGYAWTELPSGREIGFVDVPGHERFIANMLAGVGPVRLVLFVVAADEGWKPQSEEHLQILDVLGVSGGVVALTKRDLVDDETLEIAAAEVDEKLAGTVLDGAPVIGVSSTTGEGVDELAKALDEMLDAASAPESTRSRLFVDRVFTITGAGTVVTGTLGGDCLTVGEEVELYPTGHVARIRSLQTHKKKEDRACPVSRVAANLVGTERGDLERGDALGAPGQWRPVTTFDAEVRTVRGVDAIPARGAFKVYAGASEADARIRLGATAGGTAVARIKVGRPLVLDVGDRFVIREAGRRATIGGGTVLDVAPPRSFTKAEHLEFLERRRHAARAALPALHTEEHGAARAADVLTATGAEPPPELRAGSWCVTDRVRDAVTSGLHDILEEFHRERPLEEGAGLGDVRGAVAKLLREAGAPTDPTLIDALMDATPGVARTASTVRLETHAVTLEGRTDDIERLLEAIGGEAEAAPPSVGDLVAAGIPRDVIDAAARQGLIVRPSPEIVVTRGFTDRALELIRAQAPQGTSVSQLREHLGTSRKYAVPLVEWMDREGLTRRQGDLRYPR